MKRGVGVLLLALALAPLQNAMDARLSAFRNQEAVLLAWSGAAMKKLTPGFSGIVSDLYWLRTVQYYGGQRLFTTERRFDLVAPLVDVTVTLDPRFEVAYRLGALFLSEQPPAGAGRPVEGEKLLIRGTVANPSNWRLAQELAYFQAEFLKDRPKAARTILRARNMPGAPPWFASLGASFLQKGGDRATSRALWKDLLLNADEDFMRQGAARQLRYLDSLDAADAVTAFVRGLEARKLGVPPSLDAVRAAGFGGSLVDAAGVPFQYDAATGEASIARRSPFWRAN